MKYSTLLLCAAFLPLSHSVLAQDAAKTKHRIDVDAPFTTGLKFTEKTKTEERNTQRLTMEGRPASESVTRRSASMTAEVTVGRLGRDHKPLEMELKISAFSGTVDGKPVEGPAPGTVVVAKGGQNPKTFTVSGKSVSKDLVPLLSALVEFSNDKGDSKSFPDENLGMGTNIPRAPGENWTVPGADIVTALSNFPMKLDPDAVKSSMAFEKVADVNGVPCARLKSEMSLGLLALEIPGVTLVPGGSQVEIKALEDYPLDGKTIQLMQEMDMNLVITGKVDKDGQSGDLVVTTKSNRSVSRTLVK